MSLFEQSTIKVINEKIGWQDAIKLAARPLLENGNIEIEYIYEMINSVKNLGSYIVVAPYVAIAHARPGYGVNRVGLSLLKNKQAIDFNINEKEEFDYEKQVHLVIVLAAIDNNAHLSLLQKLSHVIDDEYKIKEIINSDDSFNISMVIDKFINKMGG